MENKTIEETQKTVKAEIKIDYTFYSNVFTAAKTNNDTYIEFMQMPPQNGAVPAVRIYISPKNLDELTKLLVDFQQQKNQS